jgi:hypothetical protein
MHLLRLCSCVVPCHYICSLTHMHCYSWPCSIALFTSVCKRTGGAAAVLLLCLSMYGVFCCVLVARITLFRLAGPGGWCMEHTSSVGQHASVLRVLRVAPQLQQVSEQPSGVLKFAHNSRYYILCCHIS